VTLFLGGTFVKGFPIEFYCLGRWIKNIFPGDQEIPPCIDNTNYKPLILLIKKFACQLCILLKPASLKAFRPVKWHLSTLLSTVDVDICEKGFKNYYLDRNDEKAGAMSRRAAPGFCLAGRRTLGTA
jgi:hypothetical protein